MLNLLIECKTTTGLLMGLGISGFAYIIKQFFTWKSKQIDFEREVNRTTFFKKLEVGEKAIAVYNRISQYAVHMKTSYKLIGEAAQDFRSNPIGVKALKNIVDLSAEQISKLGTISDVDSVHLYYELENKSHWNDEIDLEVYLKSLNDFMPVNFNLVGLIDIYEELEDEQADEKSFCKEKIFQIIPDYIDKLNSLNNIMDKNINALKWMVKEIKRQSKYNADALSI